MEAFFLNIWAARLTEWPKSGGIFFSVLESEWHGTKDMINT